MRIHISLWLLALVPACVSQTQENNAAGILGENTKTRYNTIASIPLPPGYSVCTPDGGAFAAWLGKLSLKKDKRVFLYSGVLKPDQSVQYAVIDIPVGKKDLQQCADAVIRLRAEYFYSKRNFDSIYFHATDGSVMSFVDWRKGTRYKLSGNKLKTIFTTSINSDLRADFENYLENVFSYAGTSSLAAELKPVHPLDQVKAGDIFVKPGFPGHAMIVVSVCRNSEDKKMFMLAQGYMPAQDIHIVKNYENPGISPWYEIPSSGLVVTPEWTFTRDQLMRWQTGHY